MVEVEEMIVYIEGLEGMVGLGGGSERKSCLKDRRERNCI